MTHYRPESLEDRDQPGLICIMRPATYRGLCWRAETDYCTVSTNGEWGTNYSVRPLQDISLRFIAARIDDVESLAGFPEIIAHKLFEAVRMKKKFLDPSKSTKALQAFTNVYGEAVLKTMCLRHGYFVLREWVKEVQVFHHLESLDLYGCGLGDEHELYRHITSEAFNRLVKLFLGFNSLSNRGLQRLTAPIRVMKKGLENLQHLDLSSNPLTEKGLGYLKCFKKLQNLDISDTGLELDTDLKSFLGTKLGMIHSAEQLPVFSHSHCKTEGWAKKVIEEWFDSTSQFISVDNITPPSTTRFYKQDPNPNSIFRDLNYHGYSERDDKITIIHFHKPDHYSTSQQAGHCQNANAQERLFKKENGKAGISFIAEDYDLLNSY